MALRLAEHVIETAVGPGIVLVSVPTAHIRADRDELRRNLAWAVEGPEGCPGIVLVAVHEHVPAPASDRPCCQPRPVGRQRAAFVVGLTQLGERNGAIAHEVATTVAEAHREHQRTVVSGQGHAVGEPIAVTPWGRGHSLHACSPGLHRGAPSGQRS